MSAYEKEVLDEAREELAATVVGRRLVSFTEEGGWDKVVKLKLDDGRIVTLQGHGDCCAWGDVETITTLIASEHVITGVTATDGEEGEGTQEWFILADLDQVLGIRASASEGSGYYSFGVSITVSE